MTRRSFFSGVVMLVSFGIFPQHPSATQKGSTLEVRASYTGSGAVDEGHKFYVALWDSPDFVKDGSIMPIAFLRVNSKAGTVKFEDVQKTPVFVSLAYDATGKWDGQSDPPSGTALGMYSKEPGVPEPIKLKPEKTITIDVELDDSYRKP